MVWNSLERRPSLKKELEDLFSEDRERIWTLAELREELFPDSNPPSDLTGGAETTADTLLSARATATTEALVETLVAEGKVEKRTYRSDAISEITSNEQEREELMKKVGDMDTFSDRIPIEACHRIRLIPSTCDYTAFISRMTR